MFSGKSGCAGAILFEMREGPESPERRVFSLKIKTMN